MFSWDFQVQFEFFHNLNLVTVQVLFNLNFIFSCVTFLYIILSKKTPFLKEKFLQFVTIWVSEFCQSARLCHNVLLFSQLEFINIDNIGPIIICFMITQCYHYKTLQVCKRLPIRNRLGVTAFKSWGQALILSRWGKLTSFMEHFCFIYWQWKWSNIFNWPNFLQSWPTFIRYCNKFELPTKSLIW